MSDIPELNIPPEAVDTGDARGRFAPRWSGCNGVFNEAEELDSRKNEEQHYRKHAVIGHEWEHDISLTEYRARATEHLNSTCRRAHIRSWPGMKAGICSAKNTPTML
jgi:hypothetical protein